MVVPGREAADVGELVGGEARDGAVARRRDLVPEGLLALAERVDRGILGEREHEDADVLVHRAAQLRLAERAALDCIVQ